MKTLKPLTLVMGLLLAVSFSSCQKDPQENPTTKAKIKQIYYSEHGNDKIPAQSWDWNDDHISTITHYNNKKTWIESFTYENDKVVRVDNLTYNEHINYSYDDDRMKTATIFEDNEIVCSWSFYYDNDKMIKLTGTLFDYYYKNKDSERLLNPLSHLFPRNVCESIENCQKQLVTQRQGNRNDIITILLTWTGDNISKIVISIEEEIISLVMEYDNKNCPFYGLTGNPRDYIIDAMAGHNCFSKNNVTKLIFTEDHNVDTVRYAYQYNSDNYPILETMFNIKEEDQKNVFYYEY